MESKKELAKAVLIFAGGAMVAFLGLTAADPQSSEVTAVVSDIVPSLQSETAESKTRHEGSSLIGATEITCTYPQILSASYFQSEINHELPPPEKEPMIFTFSNTETDIATLRYIDATRTISEVNIFKLNETPEKLVFIDGDGSNYISTYTIFKSLGVSLYSKEVDLLGIPSGSLAIGTCVGY